MLMRVGSRLELTVRAVAGPLQSLIPRICLDYLAEMAWMERWKDII